MTLEAWISFCVLELVLCLIPGPAVLYVVSTALARGARPGLAAACGILAGNTFYFALSATGIAALLLASTRLFLVLKWAGALYLVWLGLRMLLSRAAPTRPAAAPAVHALTRGFIVQVANPKALVFFVALLPQFINPAAAVGGQILILGASSLLIELAVLLAYVVLTVRAHAMAGDRLSARIERVGGAFLIAAGLRLALLSQR